MPEKRKIPNKENDTDTGPERKSRRRERRRENDKDGVKNHLPDADDNAESKISGAGMPEAELEYFGILDEQESEAFHHIDKTIRDSEALSTAADLEGHVEMALNFAHGKELKLACSQGFSRFLERLIILSTTAQKKTLLKKFAGHYMTLLQHRFASHICETLFTQCAPVVSEELASGFEGVEPSGGGGEDGEEEQQGEESMETLFLATLDETEGSLDFLLTNPFGSHTLRVLLLILSGRPLLEDSIKSVVHAKSKDDVTKGIAVQREWMKRPRSVPESFLMATKKIIQDSTAKMDTTTLKVMARHPIGNPTLQLLLDLDISLAKDLDKASKNKTEADAGEDKQTLLSLMLPAAPKSLSDPESTATDFIKALLFDQLGSRLLEVLVAKCPGRIFKPLFNHILKPRMDTYVKNDTAAYSVMKALCRLNKADLEESVQVIEPLVPTLLQKHRYNVLTTLLERCDARGCTPEVEMLVSKVTTTFGWGYDKIVPNLFLLDIGKGDKQKDPKNVQATELAKPRSSILPHAANLANAMLSIDGKSRKGIQSSLSKLSADALLAFATESAPTASVVVKALQLPPPSTSQSPANNSTNQKYKNKATTTPANSTPCHKFLVASLIQNITVLSLSKHGHNVVSAIAKVPSSAPYNLPFYLKENIVSILATQEDELRASKEGRRVWYAWNGVLYARSYPLWTKQMKQLTSAAVLKSTPESGTEQQQTGNTMTTGSKTKSTMAQETGNEQYHVNREETKGRQDGPPSSGKGKDLSGEKLRPIDIAMMRSVPKAEEGKATAAAEKQDKKEKKTTRSKGKLSTLHDAVVEKPSDDDVDGKKSEKEEEGENKPDKKGKKRKRSRKVPSTLENDVAVEPSEDAEGKKSEKEKKKKRKNKNKKRSKETLPALEDGVAEPPSEEANGKKSKKESENDDEDRKGKKRKRSKEVPSSALKDDVGEGPSEHADRNRSKNEKDDENKKEKKRRRKKRTRVTLEGEGDV